MNEFKHKMKMNKKDTKTKLIEKVYITIDDNGEVFAHKDEETTRETLKQYPNRKGYIVKTYCITTKNEIKEE